MCNINSGIISSVVQDSQDSAYLFFVQRQDSSFFPPVNIQPQVRELCLFHGRGTSHGAHTHETVRRLLNSSVLAQTSFLAVSDIFTI